MFPSVTEGALGLSICVSCRLPRWGGAVAELKGGEGGLAKSPGPAASWPPQHHSQHVWVHVAGRQDKGHFRGQDGCTLGGREAGRGRERNFYRDGRDVSWTTPAQVGAPPPDGGTSQRAFSGSSLGNLSLRVM